MDIYSLEKLEKVYSDMLKKGAHIRMVKELDDLENGIVLRHDVDLDMSSALEVAEMEHKLGIRSSYYFLLTSRSYNLFSEHSREILAKVGELGHEIGLHFDASRYSQEKVQESFCKEKKILEWLIDREVFSVSLHNPTQNGNYPFFDNVVNAYDWSRFSQKNYFSDSGFRFAATTDQIVNESKHNIVQISFHPALYCIRDKNGPPGRIYISKVQIERYGNRLIKEVAVHPLFKDEIQRYPFLYLNVQIKLKD